MEKVSERTQRTCLILFNFLLYLGHQDFMYVLSKAIEIASKDTKLPHILLPYYLTVWQHTCARGLDPAV